MAASTFFTCIQNLESGDVYYRIIYRGDVAHLWVEFWGLLKRVLSEGL